MDCETAEIIKKGFDAIVSEIDAGKAKADELSEEVKKNRAELLSAMGRTAAPLAAKMGVNLLIRGKAGANGEMYDQVYSDEKMFILGKTDPMPYRPDDMTKKVDTQFCALSEKGVFSEIMYTNSEFMTDSYIREISAEEAFDLYGFDIMFMLYKAFEQYLRRSDDLVSSLEKTLAYVFKSEDEQNPQ